MAALTLDASGDLYVAGRSRGGVFSLGGPTLGCQTAGQDAVWVAKYMGSSGAYQWGDCDQARDASTLNTESYIPTGIAANGNSVFIVGGVRGTTGRFTRQSVFPSWRMFMTRLYHSGGFRTAKSESDLLSDPSTDMVIRAVATGPSDDFYIVGEFDGPYAWSYVTTTHPIPYRGGRDVFIARYHENMGTPFFFTSVGHTGDDLGVDVAVLPGGDALVGITFTGQFSAGLTAVSHGKTDVGLFRISSTGNGLWARAYGSPEDDAVRSVVVLPGGDLVVGGEFGGDFSIDGVGLRAAGGTDAFLALLTSSGVGLWASAIGGAGNDQLGDLAVAPDNSFGFTSIAQFGSLAGFNQPAGCGTCVAGRANTGFIARITR